MTPAQDALLQADVIPGKSIGPFYLEMSGFELLEILDAYDVQIVEQLELNTFYRINTRDFEFWLSKSSDCVKQILVQGSFEGKIEGLIGLHSTLRDIKKYFGKYEYYLDSYRIPSCPGLVICLKDIEDYDNEWNELTAPIEWMSIHDIRKKPIRISGFKAKPSLKGLFEFVATDTVHKCTVHTNKIFCKKTFFVLPKAKKVSDFEKHEEGAVFVKELENGGYHIQGYVCSHTDAWVQMGDLIFQLPKRLLDPTTKMGDLVSFRCEWIKA